MPPFDLVVLDLDGTILNAYKRARISQVVHDAIEAVQRAGVPVTIGTGRTLDYIRHSLPGDLQLTHPVITTQGAVIGDPITGNVLVEISLPLDQARAIAAFVDEHRYPTAFYFNDAEGRTQIYQNARGDTPDEEELLHHLLGAPAALVESFHPLLAAPHAHPPIKVVAFNHNLPGDIDLLPEYQRRFAPPLTITRTHEWLVETTAAGVDKGSGLRRLCELLGIDVRRVLAIGDSDNDIPMLQAAGFGIAMGNAGDHVKAVADWIAPTLDEEGAAVALQQWILDPLER
ncbi:MAG: Cof-type HAD-IIB family hydrolase [Caldilinea sp.]|uniref:Cof-type HAD-IIB family hydrolase n=1 Tax=Caldilinea sp. TaxID=2293560 RepID=UPI002CEA9783|nr:HAD family phosphatase [Anaerolineales bacterium]HQY92064.1 Cof-type HAD-IIB family hydrolase [Caldilinea sp.]HRA65448.1 Cof-type HAD-IIB family hydrolase [Caldilinea sp.]